MNRVPIVAGNWKMNKRPDESAELAAAILAALPGQQSVEVVLCPPFVGLAAVAQVLRGSHVKLGAQNVHTEESGAFTGEVAAGMLAGLCQYVIVGHSERRQFFAETGEQVGRKAVAVLAHGLRPIICVGENLAEYEAAQTALVVERQVRIAFAQIAAADVASTVVAYEPVWAIGSGRAATAAGANKVCETVRAVLTQMFGGALAQQVRVQYGGSVKGSNIAEFMAQPDIDGALVGGASLTASGFVDIVRNAV